MPIKLLIVDDHLLVIDGIKLMLENEEDITLIGQAINGKQAVDFVSTNEVDVVLLDLNMPVMNGIDACKQIKKDKTNCKIVILSMISEIKMIQNLMKYGANGYILKNSGKDEVINAIKEVHEGKNHFDKKVMDLMLYPNSQKKVKHENLHASLSRRETEILKLIVEEFTTAEIAAKLFIGFGTVESHRRNMMSKLGVRNTAGLVSAAYKFDLLED